MEHISPAKYSVQSGLVFGVIMILEFVIMYAIGMESLVGGPVGLIVNLLNFIFLPLFFIYTACTGFKKNVNSGYISLSQCIKIGVSLLFIAGVIYGIFNVIFNLIFPDFIDQMIDIVKSETIKKTPEITTEQLEVITGMQKKFMNLYIALPVTIAMYSFFGLIYGLIIGAIVKKDNPQSF